MMRPVRLSARTGTRLNEVRPRRPEQFSAGVILIIVVVGLNEVRPRRPEQ